MDNISIDKWLNTKYRIGEYTCTDFARDVWADLTGVDIAPALAGLLGAKDGRGLRRAHVEHFSVLQAPSSPCLAIMQRSGAPVHIGVYLRGRVLHLGMHGVEFMKPKIAMRLHTKIRYVSCIV